MNEEEKPKETNFLETIRELQSVEPFEPFYVVVASGDRYLIENPHLVVVGETRIFYGFPHSDRWVFIRNNQIVALENVDTRKSA
jgi:hypothetical protein